MTDQKVTAGLILSGILVTTLLIYWPALASPFFLDDFPRLSPLEYIAQDGFINFIFGSVGPPPGRPLAYLTFALQHTAWPDSPFAFKLVNLMIHLGNGVLVYFIALFVTRRTLIKPSEATMISLLVAAVWLLHPLHLSTTLYVIQRMTELSTLFLLLGLTFYLYNRNSIAGSNGIWRPVVSGLVVGLCMVLAILSKENGILLALMILIIEATLFSGQPRSIQLRIFIYILAVVPLLLLATYLASRLDTILIGYLSREYTMLERLFTQSRILFTYLGQILFPHNGAFTLFYDHFPLSRSITEPMSTFFACAGIALLLILAVIYRRKFAVFSFAVLWFFGGHVLESSFIDLELYFEHRNYLPSIAVIILLFYLMIRVSQYIETRLLRLLVFALPVLAIIIVTIIEIQIWKQPLLQAGELARRHPQSVRALNHLGHTYLKYGNVGKGIEVYNYYASVHKNDIYPYLRLLHIKSCILAQDIGEERWSELFHQARTSRKSALRILAELDAIVTDLHRNICENMNVENLAYLNLLLMQNDDYFNHRALLHEFMASISLKLHNLKVAVINMEESIRIQPTAPRYVYLIEVLVAAKQYERARQLVEQLHDFLIAKPKEFIAYRQKYQQLVDSIPPLNGT